MLVGQECRWFLASGTLLPSGTYLRTSTILQMLIHPHYQESPLNNLLWYRLIQHEHLGSLGLPAAEFLAVAHNTSYAGYSAHKQAAIQNPFFRHGAPYPINCTSACPHLASAAHFSIALMHALTDQPPGAVIVKRGFPMKWLLTQQIQMKRAVRCATIMVPLCFCWALLSSSGKEHLNIYMVLSCVIVAE